MFPGFMPAPDALMTMCKALEVLATTKQRLSDVVDELPAVHVARRDVATPWAQKGAVMRHLSSAAEGRVQLLDGVKVFETDDAWALVIPLPDEPVCRVWAEGSSEEDAAERAARYVDLVLEAVGPPAAERAPTWRPDESTY
jgi:mannose-1-phosphate guanylyltransferase/phosphomannomutase